jgi:FkbM family methyltransferase
MTAALGRFAKPWYVWRPWQLVRRASMALSPPRSGYTVLPVAWGVSVIADPAKTIGRSLFTTGIYDLAVSETLARLIAPGDTVVDAGANVGYMTLLAAVAAGSSGQVFAWEPHPELFSVLQRNVAALHAGGGGGSIAIRNAALGAEAGLAELILPSHMDSNDGVAYIGSGNGTAPSTTVAVEALDDVVGDARIGVMKLDVEGAELGVLAGARHALGEGRIMHIVFEDHVGAESPVTRLLVANGYRIFSLGWSVRGLHLSEDPHQHLATPYEAPSFIASLEPQAVIGACRTAGWTTLSASFSARRGLAGQRATA